MRPSATERANPSPDEALAARRALAHPISVPSMRKRPSGVKYCPEGPPPSPQSSGCILHQMQPPASSPQARRLSDQVRSGLIAPGGMTNSACRRHIYTKRTRARHARADDRTRAAADETDLGEAHGSRCAGRAAAAQRVAEPHAAAALLQRRQRARKDSNYVSR